MHTIKNRERILPLVCLSLVTGMFFSACTTLPRDPVAEALTREGRSEADIRRDMRSRPDVVLPLLNLEPGDRALDFFGGGGYYSELLASLVGEQGEVLLHNNSAYMGYVGEDFKQRFPEGPISPITDFRRELNELDLPENSLDAAMIIMSFHDLYYVDDNWPEIDAGKLLTFIQKSLKSGGRFVIVDHAAATGTGSSAAQELHRIEEAFARNKIVSHGFEFIEVLRQLGNPQDDHSKSAFDPSVRGKTDRFILVFEKP
jgi:predicted methyltransferase